MALLAFNSSELKACPLWLVLWMHFYVYAVDKSEEFHCKPKQQYRVRNKHIYFDPAIWQALSNVFLPKSM
jgi:hypothetical protein